MKQLFSILALLSILGASCKKEEVNPKKDYSFLQITNATCINDCGVIVPCKVTNKGDIIEMYNAPVDSNSIDTREQGGQTKGGFCTLRDGRTGTYCPGGKVQVCIGNYACTYCANC